MFNYSEMRGIAWGYATDALSKAPALFNTNEWIDEYVKNSRAHLFIKLAAPGAMLGWPIGIREGIRTYWDKSYKTPIHNELWRTLEMYEKPERYRVTFDSPPEVKQRNYEKFLIRWMGEKVKYGYSDYAEESIAQIDL
jgi:hypothetical protein